MYSLTSARIHLLRRENRDQKVRFSCWLRLAESDSNSLILPLSPQDSCSPSVSDEDVEHCSCLLLLSSELERLAGFVTLSLGKLRFCFSSDTFTDAVNVNCSDVESHSPCDSTLNPIEFDHKFCHNPSSFRKYGTTGLSIVRHLHILRNLHDWLQAGLEAVMGVINWPTCILYIAPKCVPNTRELHRFFSCSISSRTQNIQSRLQWSSTVTW